MKRSKRWIISFSLLCMEALFVGLLIGGGLGLLIRMWLALG